MKKLFTCAMILTLSACASSQHDINAAQEEALSCMKDKAPALDDHSSDATAVAHGLVSACGEEIIHSEDVAGEGMNLSAYNNIFKPRADATFFNAATEIVLQERSR